MTTVARLTAALGRPQALREVFDADGFLGAVGRWRHEGARVDLRGTDTVQVVFNVSGGQRVELRTPTGSRHRTVRAGSVGIVAADVPVEVAVSGRADTVQIILSRKLFAPSTTGTLSRAHLQAAGAQLLVELARGGARQQPDALAIILRRVAGSLSLLGAQAPPPFVRGGLSPTARRRVRALVDARLRTDWCAPVPLEELARAAGLSVHHFIKAFRQTEGTTPHASMIARRLDLALTLMLQADAPVDWIAMQTGFSSSAHFVSAFRRRLGTTPGALRAAALSLSKP